MPRTKNTTNTDVKRSMRLITKKATGNAPACKPSLRSLHVRLAVNETWTEVFAELDTKTNSETTRDKSLLSKTTKTLTATTGRKECMCRRL